MRKTIRLSERMLASLTTTKSEEMFWDSVVSGFGVRARNSGRKTFIAYFRFETNGRTVQKKVSLGTYPEMQVEAARKAALNLIAKASLGEDPTAKPKELEAEEVNGITIAELCAEWLEDDGKRSRMRGKRYGELRDPKNVALDRGRILRHIDPLIGKIRVIDLTPKNIRKMRDDIASGKTAVRVKTKKTRPSDCQRRRRHGGSNRAHFIDHS